tara:strand:- start:59 stop:265 length:207 start_codon:yes stop_codon:yes gene_type:complete
MQGTVRNENEPDVEWVANKKADSFRPCISPATILIAWITLFFWLLVIKSMPDTKTSNFYNKLSFFVKK